ncbi:hypothetical protein AOCH_003659 [Aspergillus ochraceoroseus]|uniref:Partial AB-hydrolase lipase domain-containing protein n=2 Tax=Aspergillus ochraceoroseus TaxID=138278 RepID=A0A0F8V249_9EURO|nr:hypothetical protein AOCH_003659 [Aspergillus ochraceoroseus]
MLIPPNPDNYGLVSAAGSLPGAHQASLPPKPKPETEASIMATETRFTELETNAETPSPSQPILELQRLERLQNGGDEDKESTATDGLFHDRPQSRQSQGCSGAPFFSVPAHPLFPPLPSYNPPSAFNVLQYLGVRCISFVLSLLFLGVIVVSAFFRSLWFLLARMGQYVRGKNPREQRKFYAEERARKLERKTASRKWKLRQEKREVDEEVPDECPPLEGGKDPIVCNVAYYARRVGLDVETFKVQTEDGFILTMWHVYNPQEYAALPASERNDRGPHVFNGRKHRQPSARSHSKYPVLLMHGLLQNSGAYCANDDDSLAFFLCKSGYDVWLGNNRCGIEPEHASLSASDPRLWSWTIQHMGVFDLAALVSRVLYETGYEKLGLVCHSQGTAQTFVALAKDQRPELGARISVFCALAPAVYAGPLVECVYFRFMRIISPATFRLFFGIHSFIPFMLTVRRHIHPRIYGALGYLVFSFLFNWSDARWDHGLRDRMFQFAPVYVSTETIRWWLGADGFATQKCILGTRETCLAEVQEDRRAQSSNQDAINERTDTPWYSSQAPPLALWVAGSDDLVDGRRLLQRLNSGREPHVQVVHAKVIEGYEHLDVLWAMDMIEQVGREVRQVVWTTMPADARAMSVRPRGVE